jgi:hypothetical protein
MTLAGFDDSRDQPYVLPSFGLFLPFTRMAQQALLVGIAALGIRMAGLAPDAG